MKNSNIKQKQSILLLKTANEWLDIASKTPPKENLYFDLWKENEFSLLFADNNAGKSIYAVQIGLEISKQKKVAYFDFELSEKQFEERYAEEQEQDGKVIYTHHYQFPETFFRVSINPDFIDIEDFEKQICESIENLIIEQKLEVLIFDNITALMMQDSKETKAVINLIKYIKTIKQKYHVSVLVLAHTPKRSPYNPILKTDLAGTKVLSDLADSLFAIGVSVKGNNIRYVKQLKSRSLKKYEANNVICYEIVKDVNFLHFKHTGFCHEKEHLLEKPKNDKQLRAEKIRLLRKENMSFTLAQIAEKVNEEFADLEPITKQGVNHILTKNDLL